jgi:hypothetical protein
MDECEVEAALLDGYSGYVRLSYLILPPTLGPDRRVLAAHSVVQRAVPDRLAGETDPAECLRRRVVRDSIRHATPRTPLRRLGTASSPEARAAWALRRSEHLSVDETELQLRAIGVQHPQAAITEAATIDDPCAVQSAPTDLMRRKACGRAVAITVTAVLAVAVLASLIASAGPSSSARCQAQVSRAAAQSAWSEPLPSAESVTANCS